MVRRGLLPVLLGALALAGPAAPAAAPPLLQPPFVQIESGPSGGQVWQGPIPDPAVPSERRPTVVYLPPGASPTARYPVLYLLHGLPGSPYSYVDGLRFADAADRAIRSGRVRPFVAVMPPAGVTTRFHGEWSGLWESYLVGDVVPWTAAHLPVVATGRATAVAGLSAGGFGAVDIGLRHPGEFGTLESWSGYFRPIRDGSLAHAGPAALAAHDPTLLASREAARLRSLHVRFFLSAGSTHDRASAAAASAFAHLLATLHLQYKLWLAPGGHDGRLWRAQLPAALAYAFPVV